MGFSKDEAVIESTQNLVIHQLKNFWTDFDEEAVRMCVRPALEKLEISYNASRSKYIRKDGKVEFSPLYTVGWTFLLYRLSRELADFGGV